MTETDRSDQINGSLLFGDLIRIYRSGWWLSLWQNLIRRIGSLIVMVRSEDIDGIDGSLLWRDPTKHLALGGHSLLGLLPPYYHRPWQWWLFWGWGGIFMKKYFQFFFFVKLRDKSSPQWKWWRHLDPSFEVSELNERMVEWVPLNGATVENGRHNRALAGGALLLMCIAAY